MGSPAGQREAQVLASLNHPHIAHIHGLKIPGLARLAPWPSQGSNPVPVGATLV
jgi:hypothetical protein